MSDMAFCKHSVVFQSLTTLKYYPPFIMDSGNASWEFPLYVKMKWKNQPCFPCMLLHFTYSSTKPERSSLKRFPLNREIYLECDCGVLILLCHFRRASASTLMEYERYCVNDFHIGSIYIWEKYWVEIALVPHLMDCCDCCYFCDWFHSVSLIDISMSGPA